MTHTNPETIRCPRCGAVAAPHLIDGDCFYCLFWQEQFTTGGGLIINGSHFRVGAEPPGEKLAACPKCYGSYGVGFRIRCADGTEIVTHNLWCQGKIPPGLARPDNAAIVAVDSGVPWPQPSHQHTDHLHHHPGSRYPYPYQCTFDGCHCWFLNEAEATDADRRARGGER
jgi:hypothetical protein